MFGVGWRVYVDTRLAAQEEAVTAAKVEVDRRLESMNNLREQIYTQAGTFVTNEKHDIMVGALRDQFAALEHSMRALMDAQAQSATQNRDALETRIAALELYRSAAEGRAALLNQLVIVIPIFASIIVGVVEFLIIKFVK